MRFTLVALAILSCVGVAAFSVSAQQCDDFESCTSNDMCSDGECIGTPAAGGSCDDGDPCTINDQCAGGTCAGTMAPSGTACGDGCGTCMFGFCLPEISQNGQACNDGQPCTTEDACQFGFCFGQLRVCPDSDGNACTADICNPTTGQCLTFVPCVSCTTCRATGGSTFTCDPAGNGTACEDFNVCTSNSTCSGGECVAGPPGTPAGGTPTPTATLAVATATVTVGAPTVTPTGPRPCVGDCGADGQVSVDEIIRAVNIALGNLTVDDCPAADANGDRQVTVDEIVVAVNNALNGCS